MRFSNKLENFLNVSLSVFQKKQLFVRNYFVQMISLLLFGFLVGSLFGGIASNIKEYCVSDAYLGITLIFFMETISYLAYRAQNRPFLFFIISSKKLEKKIWRFINIFKIGVMFGFFVDAFKVGS